jgi:hypothetical protein
MRGADLGPGELFSDVDIDERVPAKHPLRKIRQIVNDMLQGLDGAFSKLYGVRGRRSIRRSGCLAPLCCRRLTRSARSAGSWRSSTTTCFIAGLWGLASGIRCIH